MELCMNACELISSRIGALCKYSGVVVGMGLISDGRILAIHGGRKPSCLET